MRSGILFDRMLGGLRHGGLSVTARLTGDAPPPPVDETAPTITSDDPSGTYLEGAAIGGTLTANEAVTWTVSGDDADAVTIDAQTGEWSLEATDYETQAAYSLIFTATDDAGNSMALPVEIAIGDKDEIAPTITSDDPSGEYADGTPVGGTLTADEEVTWAVGGADAGAVTLDAETGDWSLEATDYAAKASYSFSFIATDAAGNPSDPQPVAIAIAEPVPVVPINLLAPEIIGSKQSGKTVVLDLGEWDYAVSYEVRVQTDDGAPATLLDWTETADAYSWTLPPEAVDKSLILTVRATGAEGDQVTEDSPAFGPVAAGGPYDAPVSNAKAKDFNINDGSTSVTLDQVTVDQAANRKLVVQSFFTGSTTDVAVTATFAGMEMTLVASHFMVDITRFGHQHVFELNDPPVGTYDVVVTRGDGASARWNVSAFQLSDVAPGAAIDIDYAVNTNTVAAYPSPTSAIADASDHMFTFVASEMEGSGVDWALTPGLVDVVYNDPPSSPVKSRVAKRWPGNEAGFAPGNFDVGAWATTGGNSRHCMQVSIVWRGAPPQEVLPIYYIDAAAGDNGNDGLSPETAFKTTDALDPLSPFVAGTQLIFEDGQIHRPSARVSEGQLHSWRAAGTADAAVEIKTRNGGPAWIGGDEVRADWDASSAAETNAAAYAAGAEKITLDATWPRKASFACGDSVMLQPCLWNPEHGYPSSIHDWDEQAFGTDSYSFVVEADVQEGSEPQAAFDASKAVRCTGIASGGAYDWTVRIHDAALIAHYFEAGTTPVGAVCAFRTANNQLRWELISAWDSAAGYIEIAYSDGSNRGPHRDFFYTILLHPLDLRREGQFCRSLDGSDLHAIFPAGTGEKSVAGTALGLLLSGNYWKIRNVGLRRFAGEDGDGTDALLRLSGAHHDFDWSTTAWPVGVAPFMEGINPARPPALATHLFGSTRCTASTIRGQAGVQLRHHSLFRNNYGDNNTFEDSWAREMGRTLWYNSGTSHGNRFSNLDGCEHGAVHGNVTTDYQGSYDNRFDRIAFTNANSGITSQGEPDSGTKRKWFTRAFGSAARSISTAQLGLAGYEVHTPLVRIDEGETEALYDTLLLTPVYATSLYAGIDSAGAHPETGSTYQRIIGRQIDCEVAGGTGSGEGSFLKNVLATLNPLTSWAAAGFTVTDSEVDPAEEWSGCVSERMQQELTINDARDGYQSVQLGPNKFDWQIEPYGTAPTMVDLKITTDWSRDGHQAGKAMGNIIRTRAGSTISLPAGEGSNDLLGLDLNVAFPLAPLPAGDYAIVVDEANAGATNGPTHRSTIPFTVLPF